MQRVLDKVNAHPHLSVFLAERHWGTPYLFRHLAQRQACVWLELSREDEGDAVAVGNKLAAALERALGAQLIGRGMPFEYGVAILQQHLGLFEPLTIILSGAAFAQDLADALAQLQSGRVRVILAFERLPDQFLIPEEALVLQTDDLRLTPQEAHTLAENRLGEVETLNLLRVSGGAYETFLLALHQHLSLPPKLRPHPEGAAPPPGADMAVPPQVFLTVLERRGQWIEALEVAAEHVPRRVPALLTDAGEAYFERGLYTKLADLLETLPGEVQADESVLFWRLRCAIRLNRVYELREHVEYSLRGPRRARPPRSIRFTAPRRARF